MHTLHSLGRNSCTLVAFPIHSGLPMFPMSPLLESSTTSFSTRTLGTSQSASGARSGDAPHGWPVRTGTSATGALVARTGRSRPASRVRRVSRASADSDREHEASPLTPGPVPALWHYLRTHRQDFSDRDSAVLPSVFTTLKVFLEGVDAEGLCVGPDDVRRLGRGGIGYQEVYSDPEMTLCIFLLRAGAVIPLHDHPRMYVFGRLLFGRMRVVSFDVEPLEEGQGSLLGRLRSLDTLGPVPVTYGLGPEEGNVHQLQALEDAAFFDVVTPSYDHRQQRDCTYFSCRARDDGEGGGYLLTPANPRNFCTEVVPYRGPPFPPRRPFVH